MEKEELLAKAKRDYPIGTVFDSTGGFKNCKIIENSTYDYIRNGLQVRNSSGNFIGRLYKEQDQKWAKIITKGKLKETYAIY